MFFLTDSLIRLSSSLRYGKSSFALSGAPRITMARGSIARYRHLIVLLDSDRKGRYLTRRIISQLEHRMTIDLSFKRKLVAITKGKVRNVENLSSYVD